LIVNDVFDAVSIELVCEKVKSDIEAGFTHTTFVYTISGNITEVIKPKSKNHLLLLKNVSFRSKK
jgi:hypothetical protein